MTRPQRRKRRPRRPIKPVCSGRRLSNDVLTAWQERGAYAGRVIDELCRARRVTAQDRGFAVDLTYTAIRRQATIDAILAAFVDRPRKNVEAGLWRLLQIGCCQLVLMDRVPQHAAVDETTELAKELGKPQWTGIVNGVLRTLAGSTSVTDETSAAATRVPLNDGASCELSRPAFADPEQDVVKYLVQAYSYPRWLIRDWTTAYGQDECLRLCHWFNQPPPVTVRVNLRQAERDAVQANLAAIGIPAHPGNFPESLLTSASLRPNDVPGFQEGTFSVQDESAMSAARLLTPQPGEVILDVCAAPGGKSTHLAELMNDQGQVVATDVDAERLRLVDEGARRLRLECIQTQAVAPDGHDLPGGPFDAILVDVPCSNTGVLGKRPEARWRITPDSTAELIAIQERLLTQSLERVRNGGRVVYSTCSIDARENRGVVDAVLASVSGFKVEEERCHVPGQPGDGGYQALLRRIG